MGKSKASIVVLGLSLLVLQACTTTVYVQDLPPNQVLALDKELYLMPVKYNIYKSHKDFIEAYNVSIGRSGVEYTYQFNDIIFYSEPGDEVLYITYTRRVPGVVAGAIIGLLVGNVAHNLSADLPARSTHNLTSGVSLIYMGMGMIGGGLVGIPQKIQVESRMTEQTATRRRRPVPTGWIID